MSRYSFRSTQAALLGEEVTVTSVSFPSKMMALPYFKDQMTPKHFAFKATRCSAVGGIVAY